MKSIQMDIYNRWGIKIFSTNDKYPMWDGKFNGNIVSDGVYYYVVKYTNSANDSGEQTGFVQVIH
jgi:gliding motility-associated-like protein